MMNAARENLRWKQSELALAHQTGDQISSALERTNAIVNGIAAELVSFEELEKTETKALADAMKRGEEPPNLSTKKSPYDERLRLEDRKRGMEGALAELGVQLAEAEPAIDAAKVDEERARDAVLASHVAGRFVEAQKLVVALEKILPEPHAASWLEVNGLRDFLYQLKHKFSSPHPDTNSASVVLRAWKAALGVDPMAQPSVKAAAALAKSEADARAAREAVEQAKEASIKRNRQPSARLCSALTARPRRPPKVH
jgi:hypothetical protein